GARRLVVDLPDGHELLQPGRGGDEVLVDAAREDRREEPLHRDDEPEVLLERRAPVHGLHAEEAAEPRRAGEHGGQPTARVHLDRERALAAANEGERQRGGDGRLPDPALADDEVEPALERRRRHRSRPGGRARERASWPTGSGGIGSAQARSAEHWTGPRVQPIRRKTSTAFVPPKPKEFESAASTGSGRATCGT